MILNMTKSKIIRKRYAISRSKKKLFEGSEVEVINNSSMWNFHQKFTSFNSIHFQIQIDCYPKLKD